MPDPDAASSAEGGLRVEEVIREDGRRVLYYSWPSEDPPPAQWADRPGTDAGDERPDTDV
jgi:hypothetical protein